MEKIRKWKRLRDVSEEISARCPCCGRKLSLKDLGEELVLRVLEEVYSGRKVGISSTCEFVLGKYSYYDRKAREMVKTEVPRLKLQTKYKRRMEAIYGKRKVG